MEHKVKKLGKSEIEITITIPAKKMETYFEHACEMISKEVKVKGFRQGKVPYEVLKDHVNEGVIEEEGKRLAIQDTYASVVISEKIQVVSSPKIDPKESKEGEDFMFVATVAVLPEVEIKGHKDIKIKEEKIEASDKEIQDVINSLSRLHQVAKEIDGPAKKGHRVELDFEGFDDKGVSLESTQSKNHPVVIGDGNMVPGFEDALIGLKKGQEKEFKVTFPKDYHFEPFKNKKVKFKVKANMIEEMNTPELDEDLILKITGQKKSVEDFKKEIKESLEKRKNDEEKGRQEGAFIEALIKKSKIDIPGVLIREEVEYMLTDFKHQIEHNQKVPFSQYLAQNNKTEDDIRREYEKEADKRVRARLALNKVLELEEIEVSEKEIDKEVAKIMESYPKKEQYEVKKQYKNKQMRNRLKNKFKLDKLFAKFLPAYSSK